MLYRKPTRRENGRIPMARLERDSSVALSEAGSTLLRDWNKPCPTAALSVAVPDSLLPTAVWPFTGQFLSSQSCNNPSSELPLSQCIVRLRRPKVGVAVIRSVFAWPKMPCFTAERLTVPQEISDERKGCEPAVACARCVC